MKKRMIKLMTIFCMAGILTVNPAIIGLAEEAEAVGADVSEGTEEVEEKPAEKVVEELEAEAEVQGQNENDVTVQAGESDSEPDTDVDYVKKVIWKYNNYDNGGGKTTSTKDTENFKVGKTISFPTISDNERRNGYEFIGWYKDGELVQSLKEGSYEIKEEDIGKELTFIAGWRQTVSASIDGGNELVSMDVKEAVSATELTYQFPSTINETTDTGDFTFADKWMINGEGPFEAGTTFILEFGDTYGDCIYNVCANETYGIEAGKAELKLDSCLKPMNNQHAVLVDNQSGYTIKRGYGEKVIGSIAPETEAYVGIIGDLLTFYEPTSGATFQKNVQDILEQNTIKYIKTEDVSSHYVECNVLTIKKSDIVRTVNITYKDQYQDTKFTFNNEKADVYTYSKNIYPGVEDQTWDQVLNETIQANRDKYKFVRWKYFLNGKECTLEELSTTKIDFYKDEKTSLVVQPVWEGAYSYKVDSVIMDEEIKIPDRGSAIVGNSIELPNLDDISGKYTFAGWRSSEDQKIYQDGYSYPIKEAETVFTAQWNPVSHKITFVDGTSEDTTTAEYGSVYKWNRLPKKEGYTFQGWKSKEWNEVYPASWKLTVPEYDLTFTAQWNINSYKISYDGNGATMGVPTGTVEQNYQTDYTIDTVVPTKIGYTFQGWSDGTTTYQPGAAFKVPAKNVVLTAQWKINSHQVKYDGNGGTKAPGSQQVDYNSKVTVSGEASRDGYTFVGWERISTGEVLSSGHSFVMPDMDETLKAKWKVAHSKISGKGSFYLVSEQSYTMGSGVKVQGDSSNYSENMTFYVPQSGYYTFE